MIVSQTTTYYLILRTIPTLTGTETAPLKRAISCGQVLNTPVGLIDVMIQTPVITIRRCSLPSTDETQTTLIHDLGTIIQTVLAHHDIDYQRIDVFDNHTYTYIKNRCPRCGYALTLMELQPDGRFSADATARCDNCKSHWKAFFRLTNLVPLRHDGTSGTIGAVARGNLEPRYVEYEETHATPFHPPINNYAPDTHD
jgi:hypothetical protein